MIIGHSPDPDDAFMFYAMTHRKIDTGHFRFEDHLEGIEGLNQRAARGEFPISAVSLHQYPWIAKQYEIMPVGASVGDGYGPIVVSKGKAWDDGGRVAIPGERTTAALYLKLRYGTELNWGVEDFDKIPDLVLDGTYDFGLLIHEGQLTYNELGLTLVEDLGKWWLDETGLPTPLGINVIRRDVQEKDEITEILRRSIAWAMDNIRESVGYSMKYGRGLDAETTQKFIRMYVNEYTLDLGERGRAGVDELLKRATEKGLIPAF